MFTFPVGLLAAEAVTPWTPDDLATPPVLSWETGRTFNGTSDIELFGNVLNSTIAGVDQQFAIFVSAANNNTANTFYLLTKVGDSSQSENQRQIFFRVASNKLELVTYYTLGVAGISVTAGQGSTNIGTGNRILNANYDGSIDTSSGLNRYDLWVDGVSETESLSINLGTLGDIKSGTAQLAAGGYYGTSGPSTGLQPGTINRIYVLDYLPGTSDRQLMEGFMAWQDGLGGANLPSGHPYELGAPTL